MRTTAVSIVLLVILSYGFSSDQSVWNKIGQGIYESDIRIMKIDPVDHSHIFVGTSKALYKSADGGKSYSVILTPSGEQRGVNDITYSGDSTGSIYAATDAGLFQTIDSGKTWNRIFYSSNPDGRVCLSVIRYDSTVLIGTKGGLFIKNDYETTWRRIKSNVKSDPIYQFIQDENSVYLSTSRALYRMEKQSSRIEEIFTAGIGREANRDNSLNVGSFEHQDRIIKFVEISVKDNALFIASTNGIFISLDQGENWKRLPTLNLALNDVNSLLVFENQNLSQNSCFETFSDCIGIMAGTEKGVFFFGDGRWIPIYKGMESNRVSYLAKSMRKTVYAATSKGIYFLSAEKVLPLFSNELQTDENIIDLLQYNSEPSINEVHQFAIDYAEVSHEKIINWRDLARKKALLPDLSVGLDRDATDLLHWNTGANPDELQKGRELIDWDITLSWDFADYIWSTDQTTIDSRSKLMVELREDILGQVTRLYFERRRIQIELSMNELNDPQIIIDKKMRISELTALIDALTGGEFSKSIINK